MLLKALCDYADVLSAQGLLTDEAFSKVPISYLVCLSLDGKPERILSLRETIETGGKKSKTVPRLMDGFPLRTQKSGIESNVVEHRPLYLFGLNAEGETFSPDDRTGKAKKSHAEFVRKTEEFFENLTSPLCKAFLAFAKTWKPEEEKNNPLLLEIVKGYSAAGFAFCLSGAPTHYLHEETEVREKWAREYEARSAGEADRPSAQCSVLGEVLPLAKLHNKIKGLKGGQPSGCILVCFNNPSEESYGNVGAQSYNSCISERAMKKYTAALNYLLSSRTHKTYLNDMTIVHWATKKSAETYSQILSRCAFGPEWNDGIGETQISKDCEDCLESALRQIQCGEKPDFSALGTDENVEYHICGMVPNSSRIAVKFYYHNTFGRILENVLRYHADMSMTEGKEAAPFWKLLKELVSPKEKNPVPPSGLTEKLLDSMINGTKFPRVLLETTVRRIKTDSDTEVNPFVKMNDRRIGILKACLNRNYLNNDNEEKIEMALNEKNENQAYLLGRLFAVLEKAQKDSAGGNLNKTIKDSYFSSACATPALIFPRLLSLAQAHIKKLEDGAQKYYQITIGDLLNRIADEFPDTLSVKEQGKFQIGYYQQNKFLYTKKENKSEEN